VRSLIALALAAVVAMIVQTAIVPSVFGLRIVPDLVLVLVVYLGIRQQTMGGVIAAFLLGYFVDTFSGTLLGLNAFALTAANVAVQWVARHLWVERGLPVVALVLFAGAVRDLAAIAVGAVVAGGGPVWQHVVGYGLVGVIVAALVAPAVFTAVERAERLLALS
jgi:rod shape-determining protein MreD